MDCILPKFYSCQCFFYHNKPNEEMRKNCHQNLISVLGFSFYLRCEIDSFWPFYSLYMKKCVILTPEKKLLCKYDLCFFCFQYFSFFFTFTFSNCKNGYFSLDATLFFLWFYGNATALAVNSENACSRQCFNSAYVTIKIDCSSLDTSCTCVKKYLFLVLLSLVQGWKNCAYENYNIPFPIYPNPIYSGIG